MPSIDDSGSNIHDEAAWAAKIKLLQQMMHELEELKQKQIREKQEQDNVRSYSDHL